MTNLEGRVLRRRRRRRRRRTASAPTSRCWPRWPTGSGRGPVLPRRPRTVFDELRRASAGGIADYAGITYERIDAEQGVFWPCPDRGPPGHAAAVRWTRFPTPDGRARFLRVEHRTRPRRPTASYPYVLTTGRVMPQYQSGTQTRRARRLHERCPDPYAELHPDLARRLGIADGDPCELRTPRAARAVLPRPASPTDIRPDTVFVPFHWGGEACERADQPGARPALPDARVQGLCGRDRSRRRRRRARCSNRSGRHPGATGPAPGLTQHPPPGGQPCTPARASCRASSTSPARGSTSPSLLDAGLQYTVPAGSRAAAVLPRRQLHRRAGRGRAGARRRADALLPDRRQGRRARPAARGRGPRRRHRLELQWPRPEGSDRHARRRPRAGGGLMTTSTKLDDWSSSATAWPAPAPSRRSSSAAAASGSTSPCSATSRTATTTGSCCPRPGRRPEDEVDGSSSTPWTGTPRTASRCTPASGSRGSTGTPSSCYADDGTVTPYDKLIIATGSRAFVPPMDGMCVDDRTLTPGRLRVPHARRHPRR